MLVGLVLGLAVYNAVLLDFPLPIALYRKLLGQPTGLRDLKEMDPPLGRSLQGLLDLEGVSLAFCTQTILACGPCVDSQHLEHCAP